MPPGRKKQSEVSRESTPLCRGRGRGGVRVGLLELALASATWVERQGPKLDRSEFKSQW